MTEKEYKRIRERDVIGRHARLTRDVRSACVTIRAGTVVVISGKYGGFDIQSTPCKTCGTTYTLTRVSFNALELIDVAPGSSATPPLGAPLNAPRAEP